MKMYVIKNQKKDNAFKIFVGTILILFGLAAISYYVGYLFLLLALLALFYNSGIEFDLEKRNVRSYTSVFNFQRGEWKNFNKYYAISIKQTRKGYRVYSRSNTSSIDTLEGAFEVFLMGKKQTDTILLFDTKSKTEALEFAQNISNKINIGIKPFGKS